jgi:hypothetical protein
VYKQDINPFLKHQDVSISGFPLFAAELAYQVPVVVSSRPTLV